MRRVASTSVLLALVALAGCRLHIEHVKQGSPIPEDKLAHLELGKTTLDEVLGLAGAPDGLEWGYDTDTLVYDDASSRSTRWVLDNPYSYVSGFTPQGAVGELVTYAMFAMEQSGRPVAQRPPGYQRVPIPAPPGGAAGGVGKPLRLNGDNHGWNEFRFTFDRASGLLTQVEVSRNLPQGGVGGVAAGTFLR